MCPHSFLSVSILLHKHPTFHSLFSLFLSFSSFFFLFFHFFPSLFFSILIQHCAFILNPLVFIFLFFLFFSNLYHYFAFVSISIFFHSHPTLHSHPFYFLSQFFNFLHFFHSFLSPYIFFSILIQNYTFTFNSLFSHFFSFFSFFIIISHSSLSPSFSIHTEHTLIFNPLSRRFNPRGAFTLQ